MNFDCDSKVIIKLLDMIADAVGWIATPRGAQKDFNEGIELYKEEIKRDSSLSSIEKAARFATARKEVKEYINQGKIISYAIPEIKQDAKLNFDSDWLTYYFNYAKNISDDNIQKIWARILAEKCNGDTSINRQLIHILSLLDSNTASAFVNLCKITFKYPKTKVYEHLGTKYISEYIPLVINPKIYGILLAFPENDYRHNAATEYANSLPTPEEIGILKDIGLIELSEKRNNELTYSYSSGLVRHNFTGKNNKYENTEIKDYVVKYYSQEYIVKPAGLEIEPSIECKLPENIRFGLVQFTTVGEKLYRLIKTEGLNDFKVIMGTYLKTQNFELHEVEKLEG